MKISFDLSKAEKAAIVFALICLVFGAGMAIAGNVKS